ncbi:hypothetical protein Dimus_036498 [Dionaea muscipula]
MMVKQPHMETRLWQLQVMIVESCWYLMQLSRHFLDSELWRRYHLPNLDLDKPHARYLHGETSLLNQPNFEHSLLIHRPRRNLEEEEDIGLLSRCSVVFDSNVLGSGRGSLRGFHS